MSHAPIPDWLPCNVYIDGQYVRTELRNAQQNDAFDPLRLAHHILANKEAKGVYGRPLALSRVFYYDATDESSANSQAQEQYLSRVNRLPDTHVETGFVRQGRGKRREQKAVDVKLAVAALEAAFFRGVGAIIIVAGDADFTPVSEAIRRAGPHVIVVAFEQHLSPELRNSADRVLFLPEPPDDLYTPLA